MSARKMIAPVAVTLVALGASSAPATVTPASSADDICGPAEDPCIIDSKFEVQPPGTLDFGGRTVRIVTGGKLLLSMSISCGDFIVEVGNSTAIDTKEPDGDGGSLTINAGGNVIVEGKLQARGNPGGDIRIFADGDIDVDGRLLADGTPIGVSGGFVFLSSGGSVVTNDQIVTKSTKGGGQYDYPDGGSVALIADYDVTANGLIDSGGGNGGVVDVRAGGYVTLGGGINTNAGAGLYGGGGYTYVYGDQGVHLVGSGTGTRFDANGSTQFYAGYYYTYAYPGNGGLHYFRSNYGSVTIDSGVTMTANGGALNGIQTASSRGGWLFAYGNGGDVQMDGTFTAKGFGSGGGGGYAFIAAYDRFVLGPRSSIDLRSKYGGYGAVRSYGYDTFSRIDGTIDIRGNNKRGNGYYAYYGTGGYMGIETYNLAMAGHLLQGADGGSDGIGLDLCRLDLENTALLRNTNGSPDNGGDIDIDVAESMYAAPGSRILADAKGGGRVFIGYGAHKPPVLLGTITPAPVLNSRLTSGCPVCGNGEVDFGESCDDGNTTSGDGCRNDCQDEGCLLETPSYPLVPLCDDGDGCTVDHCDGATSSCGHELSCEEGVACTVDSCVAGACEHVPSDAMCDDFNECTDDLCNETTGCIHADVTGGGCEDGDLCTVTGTCDSGICVATDAVHATDSSMSFRFRDEAASDKLKYKGKLPLDDFTANPAATGLVLELRDTNSQLVASAVLPAGGWEDRTGTGEKVRFRDRDGSFPSANGFGNVVIQKKITKGYAKVRIKASRTDLDGADGQYRVSLSFLFGTDPAVDDCVTARFVPCEPKPGKNKCKDA
jgi:cysteine-rich repeat protein